MGAASGPRPFAQRGFESRFKRKRRRDFCLANPQCADQRIYAARSRLPERWVRIAGDKGFGRYSPANLEHSRSNQDRKSTRLNSSHQIISYAVFCLKKKKNSKRKM